MCKGVAVLTNRRYVSEVVFSFLCVDELILTLLSSLQHCGKGNTSTAFPYIYLTRVSGSFHTKYDRAFVMNPGAFPSHVSFTFSLNT